MSVERYIPARHGSGEAADDSPAVSGTPSIEELWVALRLDRPADEGSDTGRRLQWALAMAVARADRVAPDAPAAVRREALFRAVAWVFEGHEYSANFWTRSGAASVLKPWVSRRGGVFG